MSNVLGSAEWSTEPGYWRHTPIGNFGSPMQGCFLLLGESHVRGNLHIRPPTQHLLSIAPTRSGKDVGGARMPAGRARPENGHRRSLEGGQSAIWIDGGGYRRGRAIQSALDP